MKFHRCAVTCKSVSVWCVGGAGVSIKDNCSRLLLKIVKTYAHNFDTFSIIDGLFKQIVVSSRCGCGLCISSTFIHEMSNV